MNTHRQIVKLFFFRVEHRTVGGAEFARFFVDYEEISALTGDVENYVTIDFRRVDVCEREAIILKK